MKKRNRDGFSMIEVMVAAAIMVVLVMMLGMLFQQTSVAWRTGVMRSDGYMQLRAFVGALQRDASAMIDSNWIPKNMLYNDQKQEFHPDDIQFYVMADTLRPDPDNPSKLEDFRALSFITYRVESSTRIRRTQRRLEPDGNWSVDKEESFILRESSVGASLDRPQVTAQGFSFAYQKGDEYDRNGTNISDDRNRYPLFLTVVAKVTQKGLLYDVGAECSGPDRDFGDNPQDPAYKDDIRTWVE